MSRLARKLRRALAGLVGGFAFACRATSPSEAPPMGPRPEPVEPTAPTNPGDPVPGAPDPIAPLDAGVSSPAPESRGEPSSRQAVGEPVEIDPVIINAAPKPKTPADAGVADAPVPPDAPPPPDAGLPLPPLPDGGLPPDANRRAE